MSKILGILLLPINALAQLSFSDDFSDGNFTQNPAWAGDTAYFTVNASQELQLQDSTAGSRYLSAASGIALEATWQTYLRLHFNPSGSNYARLYLLSDRADLSGPVNGYFVRIGGSTHDRISLYRQTGHQITLLTESGDDWVDTNPVDLHLEVTRDANFRFSLKVDTSGGTNFQLLGTAVDSTHRLSTHLGVRCHFTVTRSDRFYFDDFNASGRAFVDSVAPRLERAEVPDSHRVILHFNELLDSQAVVQNAQFHWSPAGPQVQQLSVSGQQVSLDLQPGLPSRETVQLAFSGLPDRFGNIAQDSTTLLWYRPEPRDVVINELMADPTPVVGIPPQALPESEYIEIYNRSGLPLELEGWLLEAGSSSDLLPPYRLEPDEYLVMVREENAAEFAPQLPVLGLDLATFALVNSGTRVSLYHSSGAVVDAVEYTDDWYGDPNKREGGWSLERIDPDNLCEGAANWTASEDPRGGTPGAPNSVLGENPDTTAPRMMGIALRQDSSLLLNFSEPVDSSLLSDTGNYHIHPVLGLASAEPLAPGFRQVILRPASALAEGLIYRLSLKELPADCSGNRAHWDTLVFGLPVAPESGEIVINEFLFHPWPGGSDFVEIYNASDKLFDLSKLRLGHWNTTTGQLENPEILSEESFLIAPGRHLALSTDLHHLRQRYHIRKPENLVRVGRLPSLPNTSGSLALATAQLEVLEHLSYNDDWHNTALNETEGVSLERLSPQLPAGEEQSWHSAAGTAGWATPGYPNSQKAGSKARGRLHLEPRVFSPNQDGYKDVLSIGYRFPGPGYVVSLHILNSEGRPVRLLQDQRSVEMEGFFTWDGTDDSGQLLGSGIYIVVMEYFSANSPRQIVRQSCVLGR